MSCHPHKAWHKWPLWSSWFYGNMLPCCHVAKALGCAISSHASGGRAAVYGRSWNWGTGCSTGVDGVDSVDSWKVNFPVLRNLAVLLSYQACDFCETALAFCFKRNRLQVSVQRQEQVVAGQVKQKARLELLLQRSCDFWYFFPLAGGDDFFFDASAFFSCLEWLITYQVWLPVWNMCVMSVFMDSWITALHDGAHLRLPDRCSEAKQANTWTWCFFIQRQYPLRLEEFC